MSGVWCCVCVWMVVGCVLGGNWWGGGWGVRARRSARQQVSACCTRAASSPHRLLAWGALGLQVRMRPEDFQLNPACQAEMKATRMKKRVYEILQKALAEPPREG